jgi:hypothetical protein
MTEDPVNAESTLEEQLVAYLDGELDVQSSRRIEELMAADPEVRRKLQCLDRTWEMLDELDTAPVGEQFTRTTLEMVAVAAQEDVRKTLEEAPRRRRRLWALGGAGLLTAGLLGFLLVALIFPNPNRELLRDLPLLKNLDKYESIGDIDFLRMLQKVKLFVKEEKGSPSTPAPGATQQELRQYVKNLAPDQQAELLTKQQRFKVLPLAAQERLRQLHQQIQEDANAQELRGILSRYYEWWKLLPNYSRAELTELSAADRIQWIEKRLHEEAAASAANVPTEEDAKVLLQWMEDYAAKFEKPLLDSLPQKIQERLLGTASTARHRVVMMMIWLRPPGSLDKIAQPSESDVAELTAKFTAETRKRLEALTPAERMRTIRNWIHNLLRNKMMGPGEGFAGLVDDELLDEFFEKDLTPEQRDRLMALPGEDMQRELQRLYLMQFRPPEWHGHRRDDLPPGPPGPSGPPGGDIRPEEFPGEKPH